MGGLQDREGVGLRMFGAGCTWSKSRLKYLSDEYECTKGRDEGKQRAISSTIWWGCLMCRTSVSSRRICPYGL